MLKNTLYFIFLSILMIPAGCNRSQFRQAEGMVWHTTYHICYESDRDMTDSIVATLESVSESLNAFDPSSLTSRLNRSKSLEVDSNLMTVYECSQRLNKITGGAFDPTLGPAITAWGFGKGHKPTADTLRIDSLKDIVGLGKTRIENGKIVKVDARIEFNFSAIAKGYGCDAVARMFERCGVTNYMVEIGGEIRLSGKSPQHTDWHISIDRPLETSDTILHESQSIITLSNCGIATSGNYRNFHRGKSGTFGHTIDAATCRPAHTDVLSATVIAPTAMEADGLATAMMAMGMERSRQLADSLNLAVMLVGSKGKMWISPQFVAIERSVDHSSEHYRGRVSEHSSAQ